MPKTLNGTAFMLVRVTAEEKGYIFERAGDGYILKLPLIYSREAIRHFDYLGEACVCIMEGQLILDYFFFGEMEDME
ncbi:MULTISPECIES: hypothetical protein [unclassified Nodularia (in: cyanobacteria)]|uniref:hypothetical protein n=1 Tax=unclassified Nodularia (in: cyanobacteria) TaxID=2656917 RepID=UPI001881DA71|nr:MULTISPECIES: hypothetical protein [unclassified Nodularia (in: cyanobacteria)]MBE9199075.1 hypothetical protein [Nodularia sp. LEGE 06071]MCC2694077.1 hypothetical protein [Nodularia sp. LEGE 04288]